MIKSTHLKNHISADIISCWRYRKIQDKILMNNYGFEMEKSNWNSYITLIYKALFYFSSIRFFLSTYLFLPVYIYFLNSSSLLYLLLSSYNIYHSVNVASSRRAPQTVKLFVTPVADRDTSTVTDGQTFLRSSADRRFMTFKKIN